MHAILSLSVAALVLAAPAAAQSREDKEEREILETPEDPYTEADPALMQAAGVVAYGPFVWSATCRTEDIDRTLGPGRVLWLETEHFVIGSSLRSISLPANPDEKKACLAEIAELRKQLPAVKRRPSRLDPWLRLHLYAQRAEKLYAEFAGMCGWDGSKAGAAPPSGPYLGMPRKFQLALFQKKSDLIRFLDKTVDVQVDYSYRFYEYRSHQVLLATAQEIMEEPDAAGFHSHVIYSLANNLANAYLYHHGAVPQWLGQGIAHWFSRRIETEFINVAIDDDDAVDEASQHRWHDKVHARAKYEGAFYPFATMKTWSEFEDVDYQGNIQSWSRVDFLMHLGRDKVGALLTRVKSVPPQRATGQADYAAVVAAQDAAMLELFGFDDEGFDAAWRKWVRSTYDKR